MARLYTRFRWIGRCSMTNWATTADVSALTGVSVTDAEISTAQGIIGLFAEVTPDAAFDEDGDPTGMISPKNLRLLKMATAYQTVWMRERPDIFTSVDVSSYSEDGLSATHANTTAALLAPLARRAVYRLTWMRPNRSIRVGKGLNPEFAPALYGGRDSAVADDEKNWTPM